jgi:hypothetical protein
MDVAVGVGHVVVRGWPDQCGCGGVLGQPHLWPDLNTVLEYGGRGRKVEYFIGFDLDDRVHAAITRLGERGWEPALDTDGTSRTNAHLAELIGYPAAPKIPWKETPPWPMEPAQGRMVGTPNLDASPWLGGPVEVW